MAEETRPKIPLSGIVYGEIIYWGTIIGSVIVIVGCVIAFLGKSNVMDPAYVFSAIWEGKTNAEIWKGGFGSLPKGHWYLPRLKSGDAFTMLGMAIAVFTVIPGMFGSAIFLIKDKCYLIGVLAIIGGIITLLSFLGLFTVPG